uniref:Wu:fa25f02 n=1 Tax=Danio rerio TaxID=7955 RepID=E7EYE9_DANRE|nr:uncharacterized protein C11orf24 homolog [Danio rerio]|eukprot:XP_690904.4 uncharacterized protein C11orf24 homolog [Danio rerio]
MVSATHVIMTVHPVLVLLPILGLFVLPCAPTHSLNGLTIVANKTVANPAECGTELCPQNKSCTNAFLYKEKMCFLISCPNQTQNSSCGNYTNFIDLLVEQDANSTDSVHVNKTQTDESELPLQSSPNQNSSQPTSNNSSSNTTQTSTPQTNVSNSTITPTATVFQNNITTAPTPTTPKPATTVAVPNITIPTPAITSTKPTTTTSPTTTSTTTVAQTARQPSPTGTNSSTNISPSVPTTPPSIPLTKPLQTSPTPTAVEKPPPKTSMNLPVVVPTLPKDVPKGGKAIVEVAGDPLTSHLLNTSSLLAVLLFGLLFFVVAVALFLKQAYESYRRKDYTQVDYLINGMYADSGV